MTSVIRFRASRRPRRSAEARRGSFARGSPIWVLEQARRQGAREPDLLRAYPALRPDDLATAWAFVDSHADLIEEQIVENEAA